MLWLILSTYNIILNSNVTSQKNEGLFFKNLAFHNLKCNLLVYMMPASSDIDVDNINITISVTKSIANTLAATNGGSFSKSLLIAWLLWTQFYSVDP